MTVAVIDIDDDFPVGAGDEHGDKGKQPEIQAIPEIPETLSAASLRGGTVWLKDTPIEGALLEPEGDIPAGTEFHDTSRLIPWLLVIFLTFIGGLGVGMGTWALLSRLSPATQEETTRSNAGHMEPDELGLSGATIRSATEAVEQARLAVTPGIVDKLPGIQELVTYYQQLPDGVQRLRRDAQQVREALDLETRKLALWYSRHEQLKSEDPLELAESVALSSAEVAEKKRAYDMARAAYLKQAEVLVYNPLDTQQEQRVATLQAVHDKNRQELTSAVRAAVDRALSETLSMVMEASLKRDRLQAALSQMEK